MQVNVGSIVVKDVKFLGLIKDISRRRRWVGTHDKRINSENVNLEVRDGGRSGENLGTK